MLKKITKLFLKVGVVLFGLYVLFLNYSLFYKPNYSTNHERIVNESVYKQLQFLKEKMKVGSGAEMQILYPEGNVFLNALYALAWKDCIANLPKNAPRFNEGVKEIELSWNQINSKEGRKPFYRNLPLKYGVFYRGWNNYVLGSKLEIQATDQRAIQQVEVFKSTCDQIAEAINKSDYPYLESYRDDGWPADNFVAIASLSLHDRIFQPKYTSTINNWLSKVKQNLDPKTKLIPHYVAPREKRILAGARGSSQSLTLNFLYEIDKEFANQQFAIYKNLFLDKRLGLYGIREYPKGTKGYGDIDSGPVIWGIGGAASIVGQRTLWRFENYSESAIIRNSIEAFGMSNTTISDKRYLFGQLVMADAFIAWSNAAQTKPMEIKTKNWRLKFQFISFMLILFCCYLFKLIN